MPFDVAGARAAGYSDGEIASFLAGQSGFDVDAATKAGYKPAEIVDFLGQASNRGPVPEGDPLTRVSPSTPTTDATPALTPDQAPDDIGGGRGKINPPLIGQTQPGEEDVGVVKSAALGAGKSFAEIPQVAALATAAPAVLWDKVKSAITGKEDTSAEDSIFRNFVDPAQQTVDWYNLAPNQKQGFLSKVAQGIGGLAADLPLMIASGGASAETRVAQEAPTVANFLQNAVSKGFDAMRPIMVKSGVEKAQQVLDNGGSVSDALKAAATDAVYTGFMGAQPLSAEGSLLERIATGLPVGAVQSEAHRVISNAASPENMQQPFSAENLAIGAVTNAATAGVMGHAEQTLPTREQLGYAPETQPQVQPEVTPKAADPITKIATAQSVDEAISAAQEAVHSSASPEQTVEQAPTADQLVQQAETPPAGLSADMLALRPLRQVVETQPEAVPEAAPEAAPEVAPEVMQPAVEADSTQPTAVWLGRKGSGYTTEADATVALPSRQKIAPDLDWRVEPTDDGKFRLAGYERAEPEQPAEQTAPIATDRPDGTLAVQGDPAALKSLLNENGVTSVIPRADGVLVGRSQVEQARGVLQDFQPADADQTEHAALVQQWNDLSAQYKTADEAQRAQLRPVMDDLNTRIRTVALRSAHRDAAAFEAQSVAADTARMSGAEAGSRMRPSEFPPEKGFFWEKTAPNEWTGRGDWFQNGKTRTDAEMARHGGMVNMPAEPELADISSTREPRSLEDISSTRGTLDRLAFQGYEKAPVPRVQAARRLSTLIDRYDNNKISDGLFQLHLKILADQMTAASETKQTNRIFSERERGADMVREKLINGRRTGVLDPGTVDFGLWLLDKNPDLAEGLGISVRQSQEKGTAGKYNPASRIITLFKEKANEGTAVHEILHHSERMMPEDVQKGIAGAWAKAFAAAVKRATPEQRQALQAMTESMGGAEDARKTVKQAFRDGVLKYDEHYQLVNPSEFWAVNATRILNDRYVAKSSWVGRARQWLGEMVEKAKSAFGLKSDAAVIKGLQSVLNGDGTFASKTMLSKLGEFEAPAAERTDSDLPDELQERKPYAGPGAQMIHSASDFFSELRNDALMKTAPMSATDNRKAQAVAQKFANEMRMARMQWERVRDHIEKNFTPEQREKMWNAADEENVERQRQSEKPNYVRPEGVGLDRLSQQEREAVQTLHEYGEELLQRAKDAGMFEGEGLPYWTPRMAVMIGEDGEVGKIPGGGQRTVSDGTGRNISTNASSLKQRKYLTTEETEAAASALAKEKGGSGAKVVRDIMTMPLAMARLERAIAGRELVNQVKAIGQATGQDIINNTGGDGYVTIAHPAFSTWKPRFAEVDGKTVVATDQTGEPVFDRVPMYIRKDWEGPLRAVMSSKDGAIYSGYMLLKSKAMSAIMFSPLMHNLVIYGRGLAYSPLKVGSGYLYIKGHFLSKDMDTVRQALRDGVVPIGANRSNALDVTELAGAVPKMGAWGDPNESWVSLSVQKLGNAFHSGWGDSGKRGLDAAGDFVHHTLLWNMIGKLQLGLYADAKQYFVGKGLSEQAAGTLAAHFANRYGGIVANENMSEMARKTANVLMFSRSFNMVNLGTIKDVFTGLPAGLKAQLFERVPEAEAAKAVNVARRKAFSALTMDLGFALMLTSLVQDAVDHFKRDKSLGDIAQGYVDRLQSMIQGIGQHPFDSDRWNPYRLSSTWANEPGKKNRIDMGPNIGDRHEYMRLPTGKVVEDLIGWVFNPGETFSNKMSPIAKSVWQAVENDKGFGVPVRDPNGSMAKQAFDTAKHLVKAQVPADSLKQLYDLTRGRASDLDKDKLVGSLTGFTYSQGHPGGPEAAVNAVTQERFDQAKKYVMQQVKDDLNAWNVDEAIQKMQDIGMTQREINSAINRVESPRSGLSKQARQQFERRANEQEREEMDRQRSRVR